MTKNYFFSNVLLRLFPSIETHTLFLSSKKIPLRNNWNILSCVLLKRSAWVKKRQSLHTKILRNIVSSYGKESKKIWHVFPKKINITGIKQPIAIVVSGPSGSGKTTFINNVLELGSSVIGPDKIRLLLINNSFLTGKNDNQYDLESYALTSWLCEELFKNKNNLIIERTLEYIEDLQIIIDMCIKNRYRTLYLINIDSPLNTCLDRLKGRRNEGPRVPIDAVKKCHRRVKNNRNSLIKLLKNQRKINSFIDLYENDANSNVFNLKVRENNYCHTHKNG